MGILETMARLKAEALERHGTAQNGADVPQKARKNGGSTFGTSGTSGIAERQPVTRHAAPIPPAMLEALDERAGIIADSLPDTPDGQIEAIQLAVRLVQCRTCLNFTPNERNPLAGMGSCTAKAWLQSLDPTRWRGAAPWPGMDRYCRQWVQCDGGINSTGYRWDGD